MNLTSWSSHGLENIMLCRKYQLKRSLIEFPFIITFNLVPYLSNMSGNGKLEKTRRDNRNKIVDDIDPPDCSVESPAGNYHHLAAL